MIKKNVFIFAGFAILALGFVSCEDKENNENGNNPTGTIYYQCDTMLTLSASGDTLRLLTQKFDTKGQVIYVYDKQPESTSYWTQDFDEQGRITKSLYYILRDGKWVETSAYTVEYKDDLEIKVTTEEEYIQKDSTYLDANGRVIRWDSYFAYNEGDEFLPYYSCEKTYDEHGNVTLEHYTDPNDPNYLYDYEYKYTYGQFGELTQYTSKIVSCNGYPMQKTEIEYDSYGNSIRELDYTTNETGGFELEEIAVYEVNTEILSSQVYGIYFVPKQPHIYKGKSKFYDRNGNLLRTSEDFLSIHHTL